jgi:sugar lactone lactonase YvrE
VWLLDNGRRGGVTPKLVAWDTRNDSLARIIHLPAPVTPDDAFVNDLAIDEKHGAIYIADPAGGGNAALIVVDLTTGDARRVLEGHRSVVPEDVDLVVEGTPVEVKRPDGTVFRPRVCVNPIALDAAGEWLYFGPMHGTAMYRVRVRDLLNVSLPGTTLAGRVERYSEKPICDGISIDKAGNIYVTDIGNNAIGVIGHDRRYRRLMQDARLSWPDAFSFGPDGWLYTVANQLHRSVVLSAGVAGAAPPFHVLRLKPLAEGIAGR